MRSAERTLQEPQSAQLFGQGVDALADWLTREGIPALPITPGLAKPSAAESGCTQ